MKLCKNTLILDLYLMHITMTVIYARKISTLESECDRIGIALTAHSIPSTNESLDKWSLYQFSYLQNGWVDTILTCF